MLLGALIDAGIALDDVRAALGKLAIAPETVWTERVIRAGISATKFCVRGEDQVPAAAAVQSHDHHHHDRAHQHDHDHEHEHGHTHAHGRASPAHTHRTLAEISRLIDGSELSAAGKDRAKALFQTLGEAEAAIHGTPLELVHLHEVGALDSIIDIVGTVFALEQLRVTRIVASPLNVGSG